MEIKTHNKKQLLVAFKRFRKLASLSQEQLSENSGIPQSSISKFENGTREPGLATLFKVASTLGLEIVVRKKERTKNPDEGLVI
ncbi:MAG: helix-turn-helix transcriptional regulator [Bacteriovoracaceae bacterium]